MTWQMFGRIAVIFALLTPHLALGQTEYTLTSGRKASLFNSEGTAKDHATIKFVKDPAIGEVLENPLCPATDVIVKLRDDDETSTLVLPCANWTAVGRGYRYYDSTLSAGARLVLYSKGRLLLKLFGNTYGAVAPTTPTNSLEVEATIGNSRFCGRFVSPPSEFQRNESDRLSLRGPSTACLPPPTPTPVPPFPPPACFGGVDPVDSSAQWVVCQSNSTSAWVSGDGLGSFHAVQICQYLGYASVTQFGGTCGNTCGFCEAPTSCSSPGTRSFNGSGGPLPVIGNSVHWECSI